jgi:allophanate hydrolase subunit 1
VLVTPLVWRPAGPDAVLLEVDDTASALALARGLRTSGAARDVVSGARTVLLSGLLLSREEIGALAEAGAASTDWPSPAPLERIEVVWDGADLDWVAHRWGLTVQAAIARLESVELVSAFCGFAPGFAYLSGLADGWAVPRLARPRTKVPAGSVAVADRWCGIYPRSSPGGWRLLGHTTAVLWDADRSTPALLAPGTRVRLCGAS